MNIATVVVGFTPLTDTAGKKPRELRDDQYFKGLLADFDIGEVHFATYTNYQEVVATANPLVIVVLNQTTAQEVRDYKNDAFIYVTDPPSTIFYHKATAATKQAEQRKLFQSIAGLVQKIKDGGSKEMDITRKFASMGYKEIYDMLIRAIISDREDLRKQAWELLMNNNGHPDFIWMRLQLVCEVWTHGDGKEKEKFLCLAMDQHIENGLAHQLADFTDTDGQIFHQYMFHYVDGSNANYIRRVPVGGKGQNKYAYEALLEKYKTPNGPQMMLEAGQFKTKRDEYAQRKSERAQIEK
ncbi:MAG: hypothetical protein V1661_03365 [bacterium]